MTADVAGHDTAHGHDDDHHHDHRLRPDEWPEEELYAHASAGKVGMWIFLLSDALMFAGFLLTYAVMRGSSIYWRCTELAAELVGCTVPPRSLSSRSSAMSSRRGSPSS